jgi:plasmid stability protein
MAYRVAPANRWKVPDGNPKLEGPKPGARSPEAALAINAISAIIEIMASITIRKLPENTKRRLRMRAARNGRSMEQEARELLKMALAQPDPPPENLGEAIRKLFAPFGGVDLQIPKREPMSDSRVKKLFS